MFVRFAARVYQGHSGVLCDTKVLKGVVDGLHCLWVVSSPPTAFPRVLLPPHPPPYFLLCSSCYVFFSGYSSRA